MLAGKVGSLHTPSIKLEQMMIGPHEVHHDLLMMIICSSSLWGRCLSSTKLNRALKPLAKEPIPGC